MSAASPCARSCAQPAARAVNARRGVSFPASLALLWSSTKYAKSLKGPAPAYTDTPVVTAAGVVPGDGPFFEDAVTWANGGTLVVEFTATTASADLVGDVQVFGPVYACSTGLKAKDGTNTASVVTSWGVGDVVTVVCIVRADGGMYVARDYHEWVMKCGSLVDTIGAETRTLYPAMFVSSDGTGSFYGDILGNETVVEKSGTADVSFSTGKMTVGSGTLWSMSLSNGSRYEVPRVVYTGVVALCDVSGSGRHLVAQGYTDTAALESGDATGENGSDWMNQRGYTLAENMLSGDPVSTSKVSVSGPDEDGFYSAAKKTTATSTSYLLLKTNGIGKFAATASRYVKVALRKLPSSTFSQVEIGWDIGGATGHTFEKISGPGTVGIWNGTVQVTELSESEDTVVLVKKNNFVVGSDVSENLKIWPGSMVTTGIGAGCKFRFVQIGEGLSPRTYTKNFGTPYVDFPETDKTVVSGIGNIVVIGDSLAYYLAPHVSNAITGATVINKGVGGHKTSSVADRFDTDTTGANACWLICGINDFTHGYDADYAKTYYQQCISKSVAAGIDIILATLPPIYGYASWSSTVQGYIEDFNSWVKNLGHPVVDLYRLWGFGYNAFNALYNLDNLHPNDAGRIAAAKYYHSVLKSTNAHKSIYVAQTITNRAKYNIIEDEGAYKLPDNCSEVFSYLGTAGGFYDLNGVAQSVSLAELYEYGVDWVARGLQSPFDATMPALSLSPTAPGSLLEVQEWSKPNITKKQIDKASR